MLDADSLSSRLRRAEEGVADLRSSKLSPFVLSEVLGRMETLETRLKEEAQRWKVQIESLRLDQKLERIRSKQQCDTERSHSSEDTECEDDNKQLELTGGSTLPPLHPEDKESSKSPEQEVSQLPGNSDAELEK